MKIKTCPKCKKDLPLDAYKKVNESSTDYSYWCKECLKEIVWINNK